MRAYLDTGSELNVMAQDAAKAIKVQIKPTNIILKGFNGQARASGEFRFTLSVDEVEMEMTAVIANIDFGNFALIIGQPIINNKRIELNVTKNGVKISMTSCPERILGALDIVEAVSRFRVRVIEDTEVLVGDTLVKVLVEVVNEGNVCTKPRQHSMGKVDYAIASMVIRNGTGYLKVCNVGVVPFMWKKGEVVTRAERCEEMTEVNSKIFSLRNVSQVTKESDIVGGINPPCTR
ncbi:unnamed protein product [Parnassius mnemosyne]|uniref:Peptidase A2 domain-containing protein n=1 Tax=Parnassius mnemosyne TaxID=213953 RepID=A0AAV1KA37_9NEOP